MFQECPAVSINRGRVEVDEGGRLQITCQSDYSVNWRKRDQSSLGQSFSQRNGQLTINSVSVNDAGVYHCVSAKQGCSNVYDEVTINVKQSESSILFFFSISKLKTS